MKTRLFAAVVTVFGFSFSACSDIEFRPDLTAAADSVRTAYFMRDYDGAVELGSRLQNEDPDDLALRAWWIQALSVSGEEDDALEAAGQMVDDQESNPWSWFALAGATAYHGDHDDRSLDVSKTMLEMAPGHPDFIWMRAWTLRYHDREAALPFIDSVLVHMETAPELLILKARALNSLSYGRGTRDQAMADEALAIYASVRETWPENVNGYYLAGSSLSSARRNKEAYPLLKRAIEMSPNAITMRISFWRAILGIQDRTIEDKKAEIEADMALVLDQRPESADAHYRVASGYQLLGDEKKMTEMQDRVIELEPYGSWAEWVHVERYRAYAQDMGIDGWKEEEKRHEYGRLVRTFLDRPSFHNERLIGDAYRSLYRVLLADSMAADPEELLEVVQGMVEYEGINPHIVYAGGAIALAERGVYFNEAAEIATQGIEEGKKKIDEQKERDVYETEGDYARAIDWMTSYMVDALGWVYFKEGRYEDAESELLKAHDLSPKSHQIVHHLGQFYEDRYDRLGGATTDAAEMPNPGRDDLDLAESYFVKGATVQLRGTNRNELSLRRLYQRRRGALDGFDNYLDNIDDIDRFNRKEKVMEDRLEDPRDFPAFLLTSLDGDQLDSSTLDGRIVVINHWGTWCGPCVAEMPDFQKMYEKYKDDPAVAVLTINNDANPEEVRRFMARNEYTFPVLLDDGYLNRNGVTAYPTTWFVGSDDNIHFDKRGWSGDLVEEFSWRIETLKGEN